MDTGIRADNDGHRGEQYRNLHRGPEAGSTWEPTRPSANNSEARNHGLCPAPYLFLERGTYRAGDLWECDPKQLEVIEDSFDMQMLSKHMRRESGENLVTL